MRLHPTVALLLIVLAALLLRLWNLGEESIWIDEAHTMRVAHESFGRIVEIIGQDRHPPFYFFVSKINVALFGDSENALRFPSILFALPAILLIALMAKRLYDPATGLIAALLIAISPFHIHYAQEARAYTLLFLLVALSYFFLIDLSRRFSRRSTIGYVICTALLLYTHFFGVIHLAAQNLIFLAGAAAGLPGYRRNVGRWLLVQAGIAILFAPWLGYMIPVVRDRLAGENTVIPGPGLKKLIGPFITYSGSRAAFALYSVLALAAVLPLWRTIRTGTWRELLIPLGDQLPGDQLPGDQLPGDQHFHKGWILFLLVWLLIPILIPIVLSQFVSPFFLTRYTIGGSIAFYILVAAGITSIPMKGVRWVVIALVIALGLTGTWRYHHTDNKEAWREVAAYVDKNAQPGDLLLFNAEFCSHPFDYYSERPEIARKGFPSPYAAVDESNISGVDDVMAGFERVWLVEAYGMDEKGLVPDRLRQAGGLREVSMEEYVRTSIAIGKRVAIRVRLFQSDSGGGNG